MPPGRLLVAIKRAVGPPARALQRRVARAIFDRGGLDTVEPVSIESLGFGEHMHPYKASGRTALRRGLSGFDVGPSDVFADLGSGKGLIVCLAARYPFGRVLGVEIAAGLNEIARRNVELSRRRFKCPEVEILDGDITEFELPDDVTVVFLGNPLDGPPFRAMLDNIVASLDRNPRRLRIVYWRPSGHAAIEATGRFRQVKQSRFLRPDLPPQMRVYEAVPSAGS
jgi:hypothetical protein